MRLISTVDAEGAILCHDITQIVRGVTKDAVFRKGHVVAMDYTEKKGGQVGDKIRVYIEPYDILLLVS